MKVKVTQSCPTLCTPMDYSPWNSPGQNTGMGSLPFSWGCSQPRDQTQISNTVGRFFMVYCLCFCPKTLQQTPFIRRIGMARTEDIVRVKK